MNVRIPQRHTDFIAVQGRHGGVWFCRGRCWHGWCRERAVVQPLLHANRWSVVLASGRDDGVNGGSIQRTAIFPAGQNARVLGGTNLNLTEASFVIFAVAEHTRALSVKGHVFGNGGRPTHCFESGQQDGHRLCTRRVSPIAPPGAKDNAVHVLEFGKRQRGPLPIEPIAVDHQRAIDGRQVREREHFGLTDLEWWLFTQRDVTVDGQDHGLRKIQDLTRICNAAQHVHPTTCTAHVDDKVAIGTDRNDWCVAGICATGATVQTNHATPTEAR